MTRWCVVCPEYGFESEPVDHREDAEELLEWDGPLHPFSGACESSHYIAEYKGG